MIVAYYSLADKELNRQQEAVEAYASSHSAKIAAQYVEKWDRKHPWTKLSQAIERARTTGSLLVIAKLGRLEFNLAVTRLLAESGVQFLCLDKPNISPSSIEESMERAWAKSQETSRRKHETFTALRAKGVKLASARPDHWKGREHLRDPKKAARAAQYRVPSEQDKPMPIWCPRCNRFAPKSSPGRRRCGSWPRRQRSRSRGGWPPGSTRQGRESRKDCPAFRKS